MYIRLDGVSHKLNKPLKPTDDVFRMPSLPSKRRNRRHREINISYSQNDTSGPLFSLYSQMVEKGDKNISERHQKDAEGILLFVSPRSCLHTPHQLKNE